jgi:hypothetical protein
MDGNDGDEGPRGASGPGGDETLMWMMVGT